MINLKDYLVENLILEGGASGHLKHIIDYSELTFDELKGIVYSLFNGRITPTEKIDGTNIQASMNEDGEVVFIRNKTDLNSARGGMTVDDMIAKWSGNVRIQQTFVESGRAIETAFKKIGVKFFNPDPHTRIFANCECMIEGTTNIMPYISSKVNVHDLWVYERQGNEWVNTNVTKKGIDKIEDAIKDLDNIQITPSVIVQVTDEGRELMNKYMTSINNLFKAAGLKSKNTIDDYKQVKFNEWLKDNAAWMLENEDGVLRMYARIFNGDKSTNIRVLSQMYPGHEADVKDMDKRSKEIIKYCTEDIDIVFLRLGNDVISLCKGFINDAGKDEVVAELKRNLEDTVRDIESDPETSDNTITKMLNQLNRLNALDEIHPTEGIVFNYKGRLMKCTGAFAPLNQILGSLKFNR